LGVEERAETKECREISSQKRQQKTRLKLGWFGKKTHTKEKGDSPEEKKIISKG